MTSTLGSTKTKSITKPEVVKKDVIKKPSKQNSDDWTVYNFLKSIVKLGWSKIFENKKELLFNKYKKSLVLPVHVMPLDTFVEFLSHI